MDPAKEINHSYDMKRDQYIDYLRGAATFGVILWHSVSPVYYQFGPPEEWGAANMLFGFTIRWSVAAFIMISGALLLGKDESPQVFYRKRLLRICIPLITWTLIYGLVRLYYFKIYTYTGLPKPSFFRFVILGQFGDLLTDKLSYHLYFVSLILGLYALTPFLGKMVRALTQKELGLLTAIGVGVCSLKTFMPSLLVVDHFQISAYLFYYLLGYYLYKYPPGKTFSTLIYIVGIVAAVMMTWLNYRTEYVNKGHGDSYYASDGFFVFAITVAVFIFFQQLFRGSGTGGGPIRRCALFISANSYGIYIAHPLVISFLLYGDLGSFTFTTAQCKFILAGYRVTLMMNNAWGVVVQAMLVMAALLVFFYLVRKLRLQRYFT